MTAVIFSCLILIPLKIGIALLVLLISAMELVFCFEIVDNADSELALALGSILKEVDFEIIFTVFRDMLLE
jgi:hypothetical protein